MGMLGFAATVTIGTASSTVSKITKLSVSGATRDEIDVSSADSSDLVKEILGGMVTPGKASITGRMDATAAANIESHFNAGEVETLTIAFLEGTATHNVAGTGFMSGYDHADVSYDGDVTQSFQFTYTALPNYT